MLQDGQGAPLQGTKYMPFSALPDAALERPHVFHTDGALESVVGARAAGRCCAHRAHSSPRSNFVTDTKVGSPIGTGRNTIVCRTIKARRATRAVAEEKPDGPVLVSVRKMRASLLDAERCVGCVRPCRTVLPGLARFACAGSLRPSPDGHVLLDH
jgi:hypothetical protein